MTSHRGRALACAAAVAILAGCRDAHVAGDAPRPNFPVIDVHTHYFRAPSTLVPVLRQWNVRAVLINYANGDSEARVRERWAGLVALARSAPDRFALCTVLDPRHARQPDYAAREIAQLRSDIRDGAIMVKVWKDLGMAARDSNGAFLQIDDPRFQPIWEFLADNGIPVMVHAADPRAGWQPPDSTGPHFRYYEEFPQYYAYRHPEMPRWENILRAREAWLARNPRLVVIGAHLGSMDDRLDSLSTRLDQFPNLYVDLAARMNVLRRQPNAAVRAWLLRHQDRVLYGSDLELKPDASGRHSDPAADAALVQSTLLNDWSYLVTTLQLPSETVERIMYRNAARLLQAATAGRQRLVASPAPGTPSTARRR